MRFCAQYAMSSQQINVHARGTGSRECTHLDSHRGELLSAGDINMQRRVSTVYDTFMHAPNAQACLLSKVWTNQICRGIC